MSAKKEGISEFLSKFVLINDIALSVNVLETVYNVKSAPSQGAAELLTYSYDHQKVILDRVALLVERSKNDTHLVLLM